MGRALDGTGSVLTVTAGRTGGALVTTRRGATGAGVLLRSRRTSMSTSNTVRNGISRAGSTLSRRNLRKFLRMAGVWARRSPGALSGPALRIAGA